MTILVDEAMWPWRGLRWAHLVSDENYDELHQLAHRIGMPYRAFQGDHYDVHEELRLAAIEAGAVPTPSRELVQALKGAGLRRRGPVSAWQWQWSRPLTPNITPAEVSTWVKNLNGFLVKPTSWWDELSGQFWELSLVSNSQTPNTNSQINFGERSGERVLGVHTAGSVEQPGGTLQRFSEEVSLHHSSGERGTFVELVLVDPKNSRQFG